MLPHDLDSLFPEIAQYKEFCKFQNCLHDTETNCAVKAHLGEIDETRYKSYLAFLEEAKEYKEKVKYQGVKQESSHKANNDKTSVKISSRKRQSARNTLKQNVYKEIDNEKLD